jgi:magnesium-protoporphyrin IX monomethyl ester (oxidative) cyclase
LTLLSPTAPAAQPDILLVLMPYADLERPALGLGLLQAAAKAAGFSCSTLHANLRFAELAGMAPTRMIHLIPFTTLIGEWTFRQAAFPGPEPDPAALLQEAASDFCRFMFPSEHERLTPAALTELHRLRSLAGPFIRDLADDILRLRPRLVACSSNFQQHMASLALLRRIRELAPDIRTLIGGANCESEMGAVTIRECPWVDAAVSGEADQVFPELCRLLLAPGPLPPAVRLPAGVITRETANLPGPPPRATVHNLDALPDPDFDDYFDAWRRSSLKDVIQPGLVMETSRGCWWGVKKGCTFCGLNRQGKAYRVKSPKRARAELDRLTTRYELTAVEMVDNVLSPDYFDTFLATLASEQPGYQLFYETRSSLTRDQVRLLAQAGVTYIQPGIEALNDSLLRFMRKGVSTFENLQTLKYAREFGLRPVWHLLAGFPGEQDAWHADTAAWLPLVYHLQPPTSARPITFQRFSPFFEDPARFGLTLTPLPAYRILYPVSERSLAQFAYFFTPHPPIQENQPGLTALQARAVEWNRLHRGNLPPLFCLTDHGTRLAFYDTRPCAPERRPVLRGLAADVYRACEPAASTDRILERLRCQGRPRTRPADLRRILSELTARKFLLQLKDRFLALAVPGDQPDPPATFPGGSLILNGMLAHFRSLVQTPAAP